MASPYLGLPHIPPQLFRRMQEIEDKTNTKMSLTVHSDMNGTVHAVDRDHTPWSIPFDDLNSLYACVELLGENHGV